jgi:hypothetical protein
MTTYVLAQKISENRTKTTYRIVGPDKQVAIDLILAEAKEWYDIVPPEEFDCFEDMAKKIKLEERCFWWLWKRKGHCQGFYILEMTDNLFVDDIDMDEYFKNWP